MLDVVEFVMHLKIHECEAHNVISGILIYQALLHIFYSISQNTIIELQEKASCKTFDFRV